jgi:DNA-binding response OmpR family regulator
MDNGASGDARKHVLLVEDDQTVREVVAEMLEGAGYRVTSVDGGEAMRAFIDGVDLVDAVVMDANMPGEKSASLAFFIGELGLPLIMISGSPKEILDAERKRLQLLVKPFGGAELEAALTAALADAKHPGQRSSR